LDVLCRVDLHPYQRRMLEIHYHAPEHTMTATQMAKAMGYRNWGGANLHYGVLAKLVGEALGWHPPPETNLYVLAEFEKPGREWHWIMRPQVSNALEMLGWVKTEHVIPEEVDNTGPFHEGAAREIRVNAYERSSVAREQCILHHGCECAVCGIVLANLYGEAAQGYIHVHHLRQLSEIGESYQVDPIRDLVPVCPNCHAVIHLRKPPYSIKEVKDFIGHRENANIEGGSKIAGYQ
jgi:putative restriction endonuclease